MSDGYVQTLPDSTGKKIDTTELTDDALNVVERQRVVLSDPTEPNQHASVAGGRLSVSEEFAALILTELRKVRFALEILTDQKL